MHKAERVRSCTCLAQSNTYEKWTHKTRRDKLVGQYVNEDAHRRSRDLLWVVHHRWLHHDIGRPVYADASELRIDHRWIPSRVQNSVWAGSERRHCAGVHGGHDVWNVTHRRHLNVLCQSHGKPFVQLRTCSRVMVWPARCNQLTNSALKGSAFGAMVSTTLATYRTEATTSHT